MIKADEVPEDKRTYYCMGSNTDGGCGTGSDRRRTSMFGSKYWRGHYPKLAETTQSGPEYFVDALLLMLLKFNSSIIVYM